MESISDVFFIEIEKSIKVYNIELNLFISRIHDSIQRSMSRLDIEPTVFSACPSWTVGTMLWGWPRL